MKIRRILLLLFLPLLAEVLVACCNCLDPAVYKYSVDALALQNIDNAGPIAVVSESDIISRRAYGIRLNFTTLQVAGKPEFKPGFVSSAYAMSCDCPPEVSFLPVDSVVAISVFTVQDFDEAHPAGSDVTAHFKIFEAQRFISTEEYLAYAPVFYFDEPREKRIDLLLMKVPTSNQQQFRVEVLLSDGRSFSELTRPVTFLP